MPQDHTFDIVSKVNWQELRNAIQQAQRELQTRFDFQRTSASVLLEEEPPLLKLTADHEGQLTSVRDVVETKLAKRGVSLKVFAWQAAEQLPSGGTKQQATLQEGIPSEKAKAIVAAIKRMGRKVQARIDGEAVRVAAKQIDELQEVMQGLKGQEFGLPLQMENYR